MNVLSLFDGMSCGHIALDRVGVRVDEYYASEIKPHAIKVTQKNYPYTIQLGDVRNVKGRDLPQIDLLIGGSPCQDFSQANKERLGLQGDKSSLFYEYLRLLHEVKPKWFLLENVKMKDEDYGFITNSLGTYPVEINSQLVSAQLRERAYWTNIGPEFYDLVGFRHSGIPQPKDKKIKLNNILDAGWCNMKKARSLLESDSRPLSTEVKIFHRYYSSGFTTVIFKNKEHYHQCKTYYDSHYKGMRAEQIPDNPDVFNEVRYLSRQERERLQTVPNGYTDSVNDNEAASLLGDGWTVDAIAHIFSYLPEANELKKEGEHA